MRRGHPGIGGWRNENPRHFRPRNGANQHFRPSRSYSLLDQHRFPPPGPRPSLPHTTPLPGYKHRSGDDGYIRHDHHDKGKYRSSYRQNNYPRNHEESHQHQEQPKMYPSSRQNRSTENIYNSSAYPKEPSNYYEDSSKNCHTNSMGDIDHRYAPSRVSGFRQYPIPVWGHDSNRAPFDERGHKYVHLKSHTYEVSESSKLPQYDYTGHRPPSSDHYGGNPTPVINNSGSFNRSVDDTVDLIRKRLLNRNDPQIEENDSSFTHNTDERIEENVKESVQNFHHHQQPAKKRVQRQRQSEKSSSGASFTKIKSKIVNQLFKMDKEKIHKLMDNPNSSLKFEYAISSLITESQYSFNRHLRSVAEKSLHTSNSSSSIDFMQNDNNTIYEDTFMKQMQCILDPQDTVLLEDIKPIVMAELSKALQLDEYEQGIEVANDEFQHHDNLHEYNQSDYSNEYCDDNLYTYDDYSQYPDIREQKPMQFDRRHIEAQKSSDRDYDKNQEYDSSETCVERKPDCRRNSHNLSLEREETIVSPQYPRKSLDERLSELFTAKAHSEPETPMFDTKPVNQQIYLPNAEPLDDDDEDPFAELDKQYHVAVDHSFIDNDDSSSVHLEKDNILPEKEGTQPKSPKPNKNIMVSITTPEKEKIDEEIDHQLQDMANSLLKFPTYVNNNTESPIKERNTSLTVVKPEPDPCDSTLNNIYLIEKPTCTKSIKEIESNEEEKEFPKLDTSQIITKSTVVSTSRKRSIDQSPSHRKEKRKKNDSAHQDYEKPISNQGTSNHTNETLPKTPKKDSKIHVPEKHNKRKESHKKTNEKDNKFNRKLNSSDSLNSSSNESNNTITSNNKLNIKSDTKSTLKTFDIFTEQPKKVIVHQAHRNTAVATVCNNKNIEEPKTQQAAKITKRNASSTQVVKKFHSIHVQTIELRTKCTRFSQTDRKRQISKATQTEAVPSSSALIKKELKISADPLERMKEIDMEIQVLLQEKFKLYSSIELKESGKNSLHSLGMAVLNVSPCEEEAKNNIAEREIKSEETCVTEDSIVEDFTSIPMEELQNIAFEAIEEKQMEDDQSQGPGIRKMRLRALSKEKSKSQSPTPSIQTKNYKKRKSPNISLIEKIITDERPIEEIISLGDLEVTSVPKSRKTTKSKKKAKKKSTAISMAETLPASTNFVLKNCTVKLLRQDLSKYLSSTVSDKLPLENKVSPIPVSQNNIEFWENTQPSTLALPALEKGQELPINITIIEPQPTSSVEPVNDIHFDMLDVSEDIEIGDICEVKCIEDKVECTTIELPITEDIIILDNSQPSIEEQGLSSDLKENVCKMFDYSADETLRRDSVVVTGNADAVLAIECIENNFIAACLDGNVYYFSADGQLITTLRGSNLAVTCLTIVKEKYSTTVYTGSLDSRIRFYDLDTGLEKGPECNVLSPIQTMDRAWDTVFVGTRTGFVLQFECKNNMLIPISTVQFSEQSILALRALKEGPRKVLLVAARSEDVTIKDAQTGLLLRTLVGPKMTVYTLLYEDGKIYCGTSSSQIHVFDYSSGGHVGAHEGGKGAVCLRASGGLVFAGCYDGCVYVYREGERRPFAQLRGPSPMLLSLAVVGSKIIAGYKDRSLYIWKIPLSILQEMIL